QDHAGQRVAIDCRYVLRGRTITLDVGRYDSSAALTIDPVLTYATYLGGTRTDAAARMALDGAGNVYIIGSTFSTDFPTTTGAFRTSNAGAQDCVVMKFNPRGTLVYSTYI